MDTPLDTALGNDPVHKVKLRDGTEITVKEVLMGDLTEFYAACAPFFGEFADGGRLTRKEGATGNAMEDFTLFTVLSEHAEAFMRAAELVSDASVPYFRKLRPDDFFAVASKVVEVNGSFFVNALAPALIKLARGVNAVGSTLSTLSSVQDMTGTLSGGTPTQHLMSSSWPPTELQTQTGSGT